MNKSMKNTIFAVVIAFLCYFTTVIFQITSMCDILAPVCSLLAVGIIFYSIQTSVIKQFKPNLILLGLAVLSWAAADILWAIFKLILHHDPGTVLFISILYFGTNLFLFISMLIYCIFKFPKWDTIQLIVDSVFISIAIIWLLWVLLFGKDYNALGSLAQDSVINTLSVILDTLQLIVIAVWYLSIREGKIPLFFRVISGAVFMYSLFDLLYFFSVWKNTYVPDSFIDIGYEATILGLAVGIKLFCYKFPSGYNIREKAFSNIGHIYKGILITVAPILLLIFKGLDWLDLFFFAVLILLHEIFSNYIQTAVTNKKLLVRELELNKDLEFRILERTRNLEKSNEDLLYISEHDQLTGLYNRSYFIQRLNYIINKSVPTKNIALLLWNVDRLKVINSTYGHSVGDRILVVLAQRVKSLTTGTDVLTRLGGDEYVFLREGVSGKDAVKVLATLIISVCSSPIQIEQYVFNVTVSMGISVFPICASDAESILKNADIAMHYTKDTCAENHMSFYSDIDEVISRKQLIGSLLKKADYSKEFSMYYQPQFRISDMKLVGMEALLRWNCPELGFVPPDEFIPIAEEENLIIPIGNWVIDKSISQISEWNHMYRTNLKVGINISPKQLGQADVLEVMNSSIQRYNAEIEWIDIEITEGIAIDNDDKAALIRQYFQDQGISISIDDFGTGYSSLGYLNLLSFDRLKIAKPLIDKIAFDETSMKIVSSIITLAKSLGILTISEGVEAKAQFDMLLDFGCDQIQGFYLGKPLPSDTFQITFLS